MGKLTMESTLVDFRKVRKRQIPTNLLQNGKYVSQLGLPHPSETLFWPYLLNHLRYRPEIFTQSPSKNVNYRTHAKLFFYFKKIKNWFSVNFRTPSWFLDRRQLVFNFFGQTNVFLASGIYLGANKIVAVKIHFFSVIQPTATLGTILQQMFLVAG